MNRIEEDKKKKRRTPYTFYAILLAAALITAVSSIAQATNFVNTDGYINLSSTCTNLTNGTCTINYNTTRYANSTQTGLLTSTDWARFNSSTSSNYSDGNNYTTSQAFERSSNNIILQTARNGMDNVSAFFTLTSSTGILTTNGITYANATNCSSGQYSRYEQNGWNCYNDASGGGGINGVTTNNTDGFLNLTTNGTNIEGRINLTAFDDRYLQPTIRVYFWNTSSTINSSYDVMNNTVPLDLMTNTFSLMPAGTNNLTKYILPTNLTTIKPGGYTVHFDINVTGGSPNKLILIASEVSVINALTGVRTIIGTGVSNEYITTAVLNVPIGSLIVGAIYNGYNFSTDEYIAININATVTGAGATQPSIQLLTGDGTGSSFSFGVNPVDIVEGGTVSSITINSTTPAISIVNPTVTTIGTVVVDIANATVFNDGLMTSTQVTSLNSKALAGNCVGYNSTHVNVTMNATTAGVECVAVSLNPGAVYDPSGLYTNVTDLQNSNSSTNTRVNSINSSLLGYVLELGQNDTNLNNSIQAVNTRVTTTNNTLQLALTNITALQNTKFDSTGTGLEGSGTTVSIEVAYQLPQGCEDGYVPTWNLSFGWWNCSEDINQYSNVTALQAFRNAIYTNVTDLQNSNASTNTRIDTLNITIQNILNTNTTIFSILTALSINDSAIKTRIDTINNSIDSLATNLTALSNTAITTIGFTAGGSNASITNSSTIYLYAGTGITLNQSGTGTTITGSGSPGGSGNISGGSINGTLGYAAIWNSTTTVTNSSLYINPSTGSVLAGAYGSTSTPLFGSALNPDTGYYTDSAGQNIWSCDGTKCFQANNDGIQTAQGGSVFPAIQSVTDDDTGAYWPSDNVWGVTAAGNAGGGLVMTFSVNGTNTLNSSSMRVQNTTSAFNTSDNNTLRTTAVNAGLNREYISPMQKNQNYFPEIDTILNPTYTAYASALSGTTAATQDGAGGGAALALAPGATFTNIAPAWAVPMLSCVTTTAYNASCGYGRSTLYNTRLAGFYMTGTVVPITIGTTSATGQNIFVGLRSTVTLTGAGNNLTSVTWQTNYSTQGSYVGFTIQQNATNGLGNSWHFIASNAATSVTVNTTINLTAGHAYTYGINCPPISAATQCYGWMRDTNATVIEGRGEFMGNLSTNLPVAATTMSPVAVMTSKSGTAKTMYISGFKVVTFPWRY